MAGSFFPPQGGGVSSFTNLSGQIAASQIPNSIVVDAMISATAGIQESKFAALGTGKALVTDGSGFIIVHPNTTSTEIGYVNGVTSAIQTQLNATEKTANKDQASGYAGLNASSKITASLNALSQLPALATSVVVVTTAGGVLTTANPTVTEINFVSGVTSAIQTQLNGKQASLGYTAENTANKGAASGYAGLNASSKITNNISALSQLPALTASKVVVSDGSGFLSTSSVTSATLAFLDATSSVQTQINATEKTANKGAASGYAGLDSSSLVPSVNIKGTMIANNLRLTGFGANTTYISMIYATTQNSATETNVQIANPSDNSPVLKKLMIKLSTNSFNGTMLFRIRKNAADANLVITINAAATGLFYDSSNTDTLAQGDLINHVIKPGTANSGSCNIDYVAVMMA